MSEVVIAGGDADDIGTALETAGAEVTLAEGTADSESLEAAGIDDADVLVVTDVGLATSIVVAKERNPDLRVFVYTRDSLPEFAKGLVDHIVDPALLDPETVAEELLS